jgi:hypothetical protein
MKLLPKIHFPYILLIAVSVVSCKKEKEEISIIPAIEFVSVTPATVKQYADSLVFRISYKDGDGDLGENVDSVRNVFLTDSRDAVTYKYRLKELAPSNTKIAITGFVNIALKSLALIDQNASGESATFSIYVVDRAGNKSNVVVSNAITINK